MPDPTPTSAKFPSEYGDAGDAPLQQWSDVEEKLRKALNYWLTTIGPAGRPHVRPVDGVWIDGALCFGGSDETRWVRNLRANPTATVNLGSETEAIILEGRADYITDPDDPIVAPMGQANRSKYPQYFTEGQVSEFMPFWAFRPRRAYAWSLEGFPRSATRWRFD